MRGTDLILDIVCTYALSFPSGASLATQSRGCSTYDSIVDESKAAAGVKLSYSMRPQRDSLSVCCCEPIARGARGKKNMVS